MEKPWETFETNELLPNTCGVVIKIFQNKGLCEGKFKNSVENLGSPSLRHVAIILHLLCTL